MWRHAGTLAACNDEVAAVKLLVELGAAKEAKSVDGMTPLHAAAGVGQVEAVKLLECRRR